MSFIFYPPAFFSQNSLFVILFRTTFSGILIFVFSSSFSQGLEKDSGLNIPLAVYHQYLNEIGATARFFNGAEYDGAYPLVRGTPFWKEESFQKGSLSYEGVVYYDVPLAFDLVQGAILTRGPQNQRWRLEKAKVDSFFLAGHLFVHLMPDTNSLPNGFYDRLYEGEVNVFAKRSKVVVRGLHAADRDSFSTRTAYFLYRHPTYYLINREKDIAAVFRNEREALSTFWKNNQLQFKKDPESFILKTVAFWAQLKK